MGMAAMLVMDVTVVMVVMMVMAVMMMVAVVVMGMRASQRRLGARGLQRLHEGAALGPHQAGAEGGDQAVACDLDRLFRPAHGLRGGIEQPGTDADQHDGDEGLQQRRDERQHDAAPGGLLIGDQIGRDHRLAVAWTGGMEKAGGKGERKKRAP